MPTARPKSPLVGLLVAALSVAAITVLIFGLREIMPVVSTGVVYLLAVLLVSSYWGLWLGMATAFASALAFNWFHIPPTGRLTIARSQDWVALVVFLIAAVVASTLANSARERAREAERRRREAELATEMARLLLGGQTTEQALPAVAARLASTLGLASARIELAAVEGDERSSALPIGSGDGRIGTLLVPVAAPPEARAALDERVVPALDALLVAARQREALESEVVETKALRRSDVIKTALLRTVSHDLRSPLTAIAVAAGSIASPTLAPEEREELAAVIVGESGRLSRMVEDLLDLSRLEAGRAEPRRDWCSIEEIVRSAAASLGERGEAIRVTLDPSLPLLEVDAAQLERALANLLDNGTRYSAGEPVLVRGRASGGKLRLRIVDHGPGIPPSQAHHVFEPFYRVPGRVPGKGSGLGLAIARGFIEANGGKVWVESLPGQGTTFVVDLPLPARAGEVATRAEPAASTGREA